MNDIFNARLIRAKQKVRVACTAAGLCDAQALLFQSLLAEQWEQCQDDAADQDIRLQTILDRISSMRTPTPPGRPTSGIAALLAA